MGKKGFFQMLEKFIGKEKGEIITARPKVETQISRDLTVVNPNEGKGLFDSEEERAAVMAKVRQELADKANEENRNYDPVTDPEVSKLLQGLTEFERNEFFRVHQKSIKDRRDDEIMSQREIDLLTLRAMKHSSSSVTLAIKENKASSLNYPEIVLLAKLDKKALCSYIAPGYFTYDYHLDLNRSIDKMFDFGLITYADFKTCLEGMTVKDLKDILTKSGLAVGGKKGALVDRIITNCDPALWESRIERRVMLTDIGRELVTKYDVLTICQNNIGVFSVGLDEAGAMREKHPDWSAYEIVRSLLGDRGKGDLADKNYGLYRNCLFGISEAHRLEGDVEKQKRYLLQCCFMDAIGYANGGTIEERLAMLAPGLIARLGHIYKDDTASFAEDYQEALKGLPVPRTTEYEIRAFGAIRQALTEL